MKAGGAEMGRLVFVMLTGRIMCGGESAGRCIGLESSPQETLEEPVAEGVGAEVMKPPARPKKET